MPERTRTWTWAVLAGLCGCVPGHPPPTRVVVLDALVEDARGGVWSPEDAPRRPHVVLQLAPATAELAGRVFWVLGDAEPALLEDLADPPLREATAARLVPIEVEPHDGGSRVRPQTPFEPGTQSTLLVWSVGADASEAGFWKLPLWTSTAPDAGARLRQSLPPDGSTAVSPGTRRALLRWDGRVEGLARAEATLDDGGAARAVPLEAFDCADESLPPGSCAWVDLGPLAPDTEHVLRIVGGLRDVPGEPLPTPTLHFTTAATAPAPALASPQCAIDETPLEVGCAHATDERFVLRVATRAPALVRLRHENATVAAIASHDPTPLQLPVAGPGEALLEAVDFTGRTATARLEVWVENDWPRVRITEVAATTLGSDAHSEYVEVVNFGEKPRSLQGWTLSRRPDAAGARIEASGDLAPGGRALLVGPDFDPGLRTGLPDGVARSRLSRAPGLPSDGGPLWLRDARGRRVDAVHMPGAGEGRCAARLDDGRTRVGACRYPEQAAQ